jgi:hypothetical protein
LNSHESVSFRVNKGKGDVTSPFGYISSVVGSKVNPLIIVVPESELQEKVSLKKVKKESNVTTLLGLCVDRYYWTSRYDSTIDNIIF